MRKLTTKEWIIKAKTIHNNLYTYSKSVYIKSASKIIITCKKHGDFKQIANAHLRGSGCPKCNCENISFRNKSNTTEFITKALKLYGTTYDYSKVDYILATLPIRIICKTHGIFSVTPNDHLSNQGCPKCAMQSKKLKISKDTNTFIKEAQILHKDAYDYSNTIYVNAYTKLNVTCKTHGNFDISPRGHIKGQGCPKCKSTRASQIAISWIEEKAKSLRLKNVKHLKNGGEFQIPGTKFRVDGYHEKTKTVFEFHGDRWHGNPKIYKPSDQCHPYLNLTAKDLFKATKAREKAILKLGYKLIVMWESDYRKLKGI